MPLGSDVESTGGRDRAGEIDIGTTCRVLVQRQIGHVGFALMVIHRADGRACDSRVLEPNRYLGLVHQYGQQILVADGRTTGGRFTYRVEVETELGFTHRCENATVCFIFVDGCGGVDGRCAKADQRFVAAAAGNIDFDVLQTALNLSHLFLN